MMKKTFISLLLFMGFCTIAQAQKGEKSITAGPLISFPVATESGYSYLKPGIGLEAQGQYGVSLKSALLLRATLASWAYKQNAFAFGRNRLSFLTLQGGYKYSFGSSPYFLNGLVGMDVDARDGYATVSFTFGGGRRFLVKETYFIDAGIDFVGGDADSRVNFKALFPLFRR